MNDNFFELGGHSLLGTRVMARIYDKFGVRLTLRDVFDAPTIRRLADRVCCRWILWCLRFVAGGR